MSQETQIDLQARIAALAGQINRRKQQPIPHQHAVHGGPQHGRGASRWAPYTHGARAAFPRTISNHALVNGSGEHPILLDDETQLKTPQGAPKASAEFVRSRVGNRAQLMTKETYERERRRQQEYQQHRLPNTPYPPPSRSTGLVQETQSNAHAPRVLQFDDIKFELQLDGSKLVRLSGERYVEFDACNLLRNADPATADKETPRKVNIADIEFLRTKSGNLIRAATTSQNKTRYQEPLHALKLMNSAHTISVSGPPHELRQSNATSSQNMVPYHPSSCHGAAPHRTKAIDTPYCSRHAGKFSGYMLTECAGNCPHGPTCNDRHDPSRIAICKEFFATGFCQAGKSCDLSHEPSYHRVPACIHFLRGNCTKSACRYAHVNVPASVLVCRPFATLGYCSKGVKCGNRHVFECPDYTNLGHCAAREKRACTLPHIDHANTLRKAAKRQGKQSSEDGSDVSSDEEEQATVAETDEDSDIEITMGTDDSHQLTQQQDYVGFT